MMTLRSLLFGAGAFVALVLLVVGCGQQVTPLEPAGVTPEDIGAGTGADTGVDAPPVQTSDSAQPLPGASDGAGTARVINVELFRFGFDPDPLVLKKGERVKLLLRTRDVGHGFRVAEYGIDVAVNPGETKEYSFVADKAGTFTIQCSVPCGPGHKEMKGTLIVEA